MNLFRYDIEFQNNNDANFCGGLKKIKIHVNLILITKLRPTSVILISLIMMFNLLQKYWVNWGQVTAQEEDIWLKVPF